VNRKKIKKSFHARPTAYGVRQNKTNIIGVALEKESDSLRRTIEIVKELNITLGEKHSSVGRGNSSLIIIPSPFHWLLPLDKGIRSFRILFFSSFIPFTFHILLFTALC